MERRQDAAEATADSASNKLSIAGLQYLRAVAALMVVFHHARWHFPADSILYTASWAEAGSRGVDIFFVISGFVMAHSTRAFQAGEDRATQATRFLLRRVLRVAPLYWIATLWAAKRLIWNGRWDPDLTRDLLFIPHFNEHNGGLIWPLVFQGWTINYEMFFYLLFALSFMFGARRYLALSLCLAALALVGVVSHLAHAHPASAANIFYTSNLLLEFVMGVWLYLWMRRHPVRWPRPLLVGVTVLGLFLLAVPNSDDIRGFADGMVAAVIVWSTVLWAEGTRLTWLTRLGDASYSIYLFHMTIFGASAWLFARLGLTAPTAFDMVTVVLLSLVFASALGLAVHHAIEKPVLNALRSLLDRSGRR